MTVQDLIGALDQLAPRRYAMDWDNQGLLVGDACRPVTKVYLALDASSSAIERASAAGCDMMITHHPLIFTPLKSVEASDFTGKRVLMLAQRNINYFAMHTNFDTAVMGNIVSRKMHMKTALPLDITGEEMGRKIGIGTVGTFAGAIRLQDLAAMVRKEFSLPPVRYYGNPDQEIIWAAVCPGSGKGMARQALDKGAQVLITGDVDHHYGIDCVEKGLAVIDAGHHGLEHVFVDFMDYWMHKKFPEIVVVKDPNESPFKTI